MRLHRLPPDPTRGHRPAAAADWQDTQPGELPASVPVAARRHPPLTEVLQGLDARELAPAGGRALWAGLRLGF